jgi:hypothetical protein
MHPNAQGTHGMTSRRSALVQFVHANGVYCADDIQKIALGIAQMNSHRSLFTNTNKSSKEAVLQTFLLQQVQAGMSAMDRVARDIPEETNEEVVDREGSCYLQMMMLVPQMNGRGGEIGSRGEMMI